MDKDTWMVVSVILIIVLLLGVLLEAVSLADACNTKGTFTSGGVTYACYPLGK